MWRVVSPPSQPLPDLERFLAQVNQQTDFFAPERPLAIARAPGRLDLMGGIADYSGALVLQLPLSLATFVAAQRDDAPVLTVLSANAAELGAAPLMRLPLAELTPAAGPRAYAETRRWLAESSAPAWVGYVAGVLAVLQRERGLRSAHGLRLFIYSEVPIGKGLSSSAALEVATMQAICGLCGWQLGGRELALLCQIVENRVVGAPCGVMDQMTAALGQRDQLLALWCQPAELEAPVPLPEEIEVWGIDSGIRHAVSGADYRSVRVGAFMGYRMIAELAGLHVVAAGEGQVRVDDPRWGGYLANIPPSLWEEHYARVIPETLDGASFLERYGGLSDPVTRVEPERIYAVRRPTAHPIREHHRVRLFRALLQRRPLDDETLTLLGELMYQSHLSYSACGLGSDGTDRLVELVRAAGPEYGLYGAKITGGGSGGTVAVLARRGARAAVEAIAQQYSAESGRPAPVVGGSSPGAVAVGLLVARADD
ncbi:galactokinase [Kallotenue papyrolyticum]|uniref:galactokinase n=1 Tax=Kallotenue papyrolyticum TaxID=1325125 RepID=UPI0004786261|nr:galactokinase family protein [Kallotenue papyrolyticum]